MKLLLVSDTHVPTYLRSLPNNLIELARQVDVVIGLGDYIDLNTVLELKSVARNFYGVHGNMDDIDVKDTLPQFLMVHLGGFNIGLCHGWGPPYQLRERILKLFEEKPHVIFYGHTHFPDDSLLGNVRFINPGSFGENGSFAVVEICDSRLKVSFERLPIV
ncbi:metallophosphatase [Thermotoga sp. Ku-13t]|uniref:metallophosphoesterase family protein n=1 Tax=Thermotoga sp. Ku-13t TaxID=1755813 RepID=UPI0013EA1587|nr:YfcE family phosphodiesterase [Thermotoga sp. Ku-13t]KAF2957604.1 metallophosphatase [Thermotoga sp. Ku-13t]